MIDLHIHTNYSGGQSNLKEVLQIAQRRKVSIIAITDNNTCEAYKELNNILIAKYYEGKIIPGCEFSTIVNNVPIELIGYNIDTDLAQEEISKLYLSKLDYNIYETNLIIQKCLEMGLKIDVSRIQYDVNKEKGKRAVFKFPLPIPISESGVPCESLPPEIYKLCSFANSSANFCCSCE